MTFLISLPEATSPSVLPIKGKTEGDVASGMIECLHKMGKKPKIIYSDDETALSTDAIQKYLKDENIEHHRTRAHPNFSERAIRTFKDLLYKRVEADASAKVSRGIRDMSGAKSRDERGEKKG